MVETKTLPEYEELIENLADQLGGLSVVHRGVGDATTSLVAANRELATLQQHLEVLLIESQNTLQEVKRLEPAHLETLFNRQLSDLSWETLAGFDSIGGQITSMGVEAIESAEHRSQLNGQLELLNEQAHAQQSKFQQFGKLVSLIATGSTPYQKDALVADSELHTAVQDTAGLLKTIFASVNTSLNDIEKGLIANQRNQDELSRKVDELQQTASSTLALSDSLSTTMASKFDVLQRETSDEMNKILRVQALVIILCLAVLVSVWLTA